jgi:hypothetical protein
MDAGETTEIRRTGRLRRVAMIAAGYSVAHGRRRDLVVVAVGVYVLAFVILSPMLG